MQFNSHRGSLRTPERLDTRFGVVAGLYVAALLSPALLLVVTQRTHLNSEPLAFGLLGAVGIVVTAVVGRQVTRRGGLVVWFHSPWVALLVPTAGILPLFVYAFQAFVFFASHIADLQLEGAVGLIGFVGFNLGLVASCLGSVLVAMARTRVANAMVDTSEIHTEWTAGWARQDRFKLFASVLLPCILLSGLVFTQLQLTTVIISMLPAGVALIFSLIGIVSERTYRVTPAGLELNNKTGGFDSRHVILWSQFESFSVTDRTIVLHRRLPYLDIRCSRRDLTTDEVDVVSALEAHLERYDL